MRTTGRFFVATAMVAALCADASFGQQGKVDPFASGSSASPRRESGIIASVEFVDTPITTVFKMISDLTGWSILMSPEVSQKPPRINIWIKNLTAGQVLEEVTALAGLVLEKKGDTVKVIGFDEYAQMYGMEKQVVELKYADAHDVAGILKPFTAKEDQSRIVADGRSNRIALLVSTPLLESLVRLIAAIDVPLEVGIKIIALKHLDARRITPALEGFLSGSGVVPTSLVKSKAGTGLSGRAGPAESRRLGLMFESTLNVVVLRGPPKEVETAARLVEQLDVPTGITVVGYQMKFTNARDVFATLQNILEEEGAGRGQQGARRLRIALSEQNNQIVVEGSTGDHMRVSGVLQAIDKPLPPGTGGIRVYKLENASASEVATVLQNLIDERGKQAQRAKPAGGAEQRGVHRVGDETVSERPSRGVAAGGGAGSQRGESATASGDVTPPRVTEAPEINAVIVKASAAEHEEFAQLIKEMDEPRDQVMLEVTLVAVRSTKGFELGVELGGARIGSSGLQTIGFTHYGVGRVDAATGEIRIAAPAAAGLNYALFHSDDFSLVLNALRTVGDTRMTSSPKILVEDNALARISQISQEPFEVVNQGETTTTTSFGGFVDAGTVLTVVPHLSQQNWLRLQYNINLSSFGKRLNLALPPPRLENLVEGIVRIPVGHTVVLGGLYSTRQDDLVEGVPILSDVPIIGELFKNRSKDSVRETLFVFIRPVILRDPAFKDLMFMSEDDIKRAGISRREGPMNSLKMFAPPPSSKAEKRT